MKRTFKMRTLMLLLVASMVLALVPNVKALSEDVLVFENSYAEETAEYVFSVNASKTELQPGDEFTVTYSLDKSGNYGINSFSTRLVYDSSKVEVMQMNYREETMNDIQIGEAGEINGFSLGSAVISEDSIIPNGKCIADGLANMSRNLKADSFTGELYTIKFKVKEDAPGGPIDMFLKSTTGKTPEEIKKNDGFAVQGWRKDEKTQQWLSRDVEYYVNYNYDQLKVVIPAKGVNFTEDTLYLDTSSNYTLDLNDYVEINPENTTDEVTFEVDDEDVATIEDGGILKAGVKPGRTTVTVHAGDYSDTAEVVVTIALEGIHFADDFTEVNLDLTSNPSVDVRNAVEFEPVGAAASNVVWEFEDPTVAKYENGKIVALKKGSTTVKAKVSNAQANKSFETASIPVNVKASVASVSFGEHERVVLDTVNETSKNIRDWLVMNPEDADFEESDIKWDSKNKDVVTVDDNGLVTVVGKGETTITVTVNGHSATIPVVVTIPLTSITVDKTEDTVYKNEYVEFTVTPNPDGAVWEKLECSFLEGNDKATAEVVGNKVRVTGLLRGTARIQITANGSALPAMVQEITVNVKENRIVEAEIVAEDDEDLLRGETKQLTVKYVTEEEKAGVPNPHATTDDTTVTWESSNPEYATVDRNGVVTGVKEGETTITATIAGHKATYNVVVKEIHMEGIVIDEEGIEEELGDVVVGDEIVIPFTVDPENCTDTAEEIVEGILSQYDEDMVDVEVTYDEETREGKITIKTKKAGDVEVALSVGEPEEDGSNVVVVSFTVVEPEPSPETGDIPVAMITLVMVISLAGIAVSKKVLVK